MRICAAQTRPVTGDVQKNIGHHKRLIDLAISNGADMIIFPELSLTGYEPALARELATVPGDSRFDVFRKISNAGQIIIGAGIPTKNNSGICISMILFRPHMARQVYSKKYLHPDEEEFFTSGQNFAGFTVNKTNIALAICYELSVPEHAENAFESGAEVYIASVAKYASDTERAVKRLADIAQKYSMTVLMANSVGPADGGECAGKTSAWNKKGLLMGQLNGTGEGILVIDTGTLESAERMIVETA